MALEGPVSLILQLEFLIPFMVLVVVLVMVVVILVRVGEVKFGL